MIVFHFAKDSAGLYQWALCTRAVTAGSWSVKRQELQRQWIPVYNSCCMLAGKELALYDLVGVPCLIEIVEKAFI